MNVLYIVLQILGSAAVFLYGIKKLSEGLQKTAGKKMKNVLKFMTGNRFSAVLTGIVVTALINSSSATTVMVVSFVNAGLLELSQAIGVIFGANIGTTVSGWLIALLGFSVDISKIALCVVGLSLPLMFAKDSRKKELGELVLGFGLLFVGLKFMQDATSGVTLPPSMLSFLSNQSLVTVLVSLFVGIFVTLLLQSSAASMAFTLTLASQGFIGVSAACAMVLGGNIGTTVHAFVASIGTNTNAKRTACSHILFNLVGSVISIILMRPMIYVVNLITPGNIYTMTGAELNATLPAFLAMFHTFFNVGCTVLFVPFVNLFAKIVSRSVPEGNDYEENTYHFKYVPSAFIDSNEMYLLALRDEIKKMAILASDMLTSYKNVFENQKVNMKEEVKKIKSQEDFADQMQEQLTAICVHLIEDAPATSNASSLSCLIRVIDELESITDSIYNLILLSQKRYEEDIVLDDATFKALDDYTILVWSYLEYVKNNMDKPFTKSEMDKANDFEFKVDAVRNDIDNSVYDRLTDGDKNVKLSLWTVDVVKHLEHIGDYCTNIAESYHKAVKHTPMLQKKIN